MTQLSKQQQDALERILNWLRNGNDPVFNLFGYAGTGKTMLAVALRERLLVNGHKIHPMAYTGKAVRVLFSRGLHNAKTIHSSIYHIVDQPLLCAEVEELEEAMQQRQNDLRERKGSLTEAHRLEIHRSIADMQKRLDELADILSKGLSWTLNETAFTERFDRDLMTYVKKDPPNVLVVDEGSMVNEEIGKDIESFGIKLLAITDTMQLPPINGKPYYSLQTPDAVLTEVHRQKAGSPILALATHVRQSLTGAGVVAHMRKFNSPLVQRKAPDGWWDGWQILAGKNKTVELLNNKVRTIKGISDPYPIPGDELVCLRNEASIGLLNGSRWVVLERKPYVDPKDPKAPDNDRFLTVTLQAHPDEAVDFVHTLKIWKTIFDGNFSIWSNSGRGRYFKFSFERFKASEFYYSYAMTVHRAQGSQWSRVCLVNEADVFQKWHGTPEEKFTPVRWLYTGITRAMDELVVVDNY